LLENLDSAQFTEWMAYSRLEPFGYQDQLLAQIACLLYNINRKEGADPIDISAFLPIEREEDPVVEQDEMIAALKEQTKNRG
jgi:hypothetical protein